MIKALELIFIQIEIMINNQLTNLLDIRHYGCVFSKARADYKNQSNYSNKNNDIDKYDIDM
jgi:hypothetical protein